MPSTCGEKLSGSSAPHCLGPGGNQMALAPHVVRDLGRTPWAEKASRVRQCLPSMGVMGVMTFIHLLPVYLRRLGCSWAALGGFNAGCICGNNANNAEGISAFMDPSVSPVRLTRLNRHHACHSSGVGRRRVAGADADAGRVCAAVTLRFEAPQSCSVTLAVSEL